MHGQPNIKINIKILQVPPTGFIYVLCMDLRINGDYFPTKQFVTEIECIVCNHLGISPASDY